MTSLSLPLPRVDSLADYTSFKLTVQPFLEQLQWLPASLREAGLNLSNLKEVYLATNPMVSAFALCSVLACFFFVAAEINRNFSQVDRFWSILPAVYNVHFAVWARMSGIETQTVFTIAVLSVLWSVCMALFTDLDLGDIKFANVRSSRIGTIDLQLLA